MSVMPIKFNFSANNHTPEDKSGEGFWEMDFGEPNALVLSFQFKTFAEAIQMDQALRRIWIAGKSSGMTECTEQISIGLDKLRRSM